jgi:hypothetical protein
MSTKRIRVYFSHAIRGQVGVGASHDTQNTNCQAAQDMAANVKALLFRQRPDIELDFYIPADHEDFVQIAYDEKIIPEADILKVDCLIIKDRCDATVVFVPGWDVLQGGRKVEWKFAIENDLPVCVFERAGEAASAIMSWVDGGLVDAKN